MKRLAVTRRALDLAGRAGWAARITTLGPTAPPTARSRRAISVVRRYTAYTVPSAFIPVPMVDVGTLVAVQIMMLRRLAAIYDMPFSRSRARLLVSSLVLGLPQAMSGQITAVAVAGLPGLKAVPGLGSVGAGVAMTVLWAGATWALGLVFIEHFESGGTLFSFDPERNGTTFGHRMREAAQSASRRAPDDHADR